jgi:type IV secretion system protein VirD4
MRDNDGFGRLVAWAIVLLGAVGLVVWGGARLAVVVAGGGAFDAGVAEGVAAACRLPGHLGDPAGAWPVDVRGGVPGPLIYWPATLVVVAAVAAIATAGLWVWQRLQRVGTAPRDRLGVDARAWFARGRDVRTLVVDGPEPGRFVLGRWRRRLVATECRATTEPARREAVRRRQGDTGAVALVGPSRSGKTVAAVAGILEWEGPALLSSVKADLMASTIGWRAQRGEVRVYDPLALTPYVGAGWSPLAQASTLTGARRQARNLLEAINDDGTDNLGMWKNLAEYLLAGLFWVAAVSGRDMATVVDWVLTQDRPQPEKASELDWMLRELLGSDDPEVAAAAPVVLNYLLSTWNQDERPRSSVYITAQAALSAFSDPAVAAAASTSEIDLEWLMSGENTLYVCSPLKDQVRLAPAFGGLLNDLMGQIYEHANQAPDGRLGQPLLVVLDEAGNQRLDQLPEYASTVAGLGVQLVTVWQSVAQVTRAYGRGAGIVLTNHLSKLFYAGLSDQDSLEYVARVVGEEEVESVDASGDWLGLIRPHVRESTSRVGLVQPHCLRQMVPGDALLIHGTLPPAHIRVRRWYEEPELRARAELAPPDRFIRHAGSGERSTLPDRSRLVEVVTEADADVDATGSEVVTVRRDESAWWAD